MQMPKQHFKQLTPEDKPSLNFQKTPLKQVSHPLLFRMRRITQQSQKKETNKGPARTQQDSLFRFHFGVFPNHSKNILPLFNEPAQHVD